MKNHKQRLSKNTVGIALVPVLIVTGIVSLLGVGGYVVYQSVNNRTQQVNQESLVEGERFLPENAWINISEQKISEAQRVYTRIGGNDRFTSAIEVSKARFPRGASVVVLVNGYQYPDAVLATSLTPNFPLLYLPRSTSDTTTYQAVIAEIQRLNPERAVVIGGENAVNENMMSRLRGYIKRIDRRAGESRIETAINLSKYYGFQHRTVYLVNAYKKTDAALMQSAYEEGNALFITNEGMHPATLEYMQKIKPNKIVLLGGVDVISSETQSEIQEQFPQAQVQRFAGSNRYQTATYISRVRYGSSADTAYIVNSDAETDAVLASTYSAGKRGPVLYVERDRIPVETASEIKRLGIKNIVIIGGEERVGGQTAWRLGALANGFDPAY